MTRYIITYDLSAPGRNYGALYERIKAYSAWARITESSFAIMTQQTSVQIRDNLGEVLDSNDKLLVGPLGVAAWMGLDKEVSEWLQRHT